MPLACPARRARPRLCIANHRTIAALGRAAFGEVRRRGTLRAAFAGLTTCRGCRIYSLRLPPLSSPACSSPHRTTAGAPPSSSHPSYSYCSTSTASARPVTCHHATTSGYAIPGTCTQTQLPPSTAGLTAPRRRKRATRPSSTHLPS